MLLLLSPWKLDLLHPLQGLVGFVTIARLTAPVAAAGQRAHWKQNQPLAKHKKITSVCLLHHHNTYASPSPLPPSFSNSHHYGLRDYITTVTVWTTWDKYTVYFTHRIHVKSTFNPSSAKTDIEFTTLILLLPEVSSLLFTSQILPDEKQHCYLTCTALWITHGALWRRKMGLQYYTEQ